jgi:RNA polymerase sigma factor (sigma-70 family)
MELSWKEIVDGCRMNDRRLQLEAYDRSWRVLFPSVYRIIQNRQEAEDVMQESIIQGFDKLHQLNNPDVYLAWQKSISIRMAYNFLKSKRKNELDFPTWEGEQKEIDAEFELPEAATIWEVVNSLANGYQTVVKMHLLDGLSHEEVAGIIGIAPSTVRSQYSRALNRIKEIIHEQKREHV